LDTKTALRVVIASPGDVQAERDRLISVIAEVNRILALAKRKLVLEAARWETDVHPGFHLDGSQALVEEILKIEDCDILIGIFWKRFGTPTGGGDSNTEHEIRLAYNSWKARGRPHIMLFFNQECYTPKSSLETAQWGKVLDFKLGISTQAIFSDYEGEIDFADRARSALLSFTLPIMNAENAAPSTQGLSLKAAADFKVVRAEGLAESLRDIVFTLTGGTAAIHGSGDSKFDIRLFANTSITNRIRGDLSDVLLLREVHNAMPIAGRIIATNAVLFKGVELSSLRSGTAHFRIANMRINANALGPSNSQQPTPVVVSVVIQPHGGTATPQLQTSVQAAIVQRGLASRVWSISHPQEPPWRFPQSRGLNVTLLSDPNTRQAITNFYVGFAEQYRGAFSPRAREPGSGKVTGTRLKVVFNNIPVNVRIFVTTRDVPPPDGHIAKAVLVSSEKEESAANANSVPVGSGASTGGVPIQEIPVTNSVAIAVWELVSNDPSSRAALDEAHFGVVLAMEADSASLGSATLNASFAPTSTVTTASDTMPAPRFADTSRAVRVFTIES
jgi:hypothetical protein